MPIIPSIETTPISQEAFGKLAYEVMRHVFAVHDEYGRFFDEIIYKRELARRVAGMEIEAGVDVAHQGFSRTYFADVIANRSGLFEFKVADAIHARHRAQTTNYLLLFRLHHGKVINMRPEKVQQVPVTGTGGELAVPKHANRSQRRSLQADRVSSGQFQSLQFAAPRQTTTSPHAIAFHSVGQYSPN